MTLLDEWKTAPECPHCATPQQIHIPNALLFPHNSTTRTFRCALCNQEFRVTKSSLVLYRSEQLP